MFTSVYVPLGVSLGHVWKIAVSAAGACVDQVSPVLMPCN